MFSQSVSQGFGSFLIFDTNINERVISLCGRAFAHGAMSQPTELFLVLASALHMV